MLRLSGFRSQTKQKIKDFLFKTVAQQDRILPWIGKAGDVSDPITQARRNVVRSFGICILGYYVYYAASMHTIVKNFTPLTHDWNLLKTNTEVRKQAEETLKIGNAKHSLQYLLKSWTDIEKKFYLPEYSTDPTLVNQQKDAHWTQMCEKRMLEGILYLLIKCSQFNHWYTEKGYFKPFGRNMMKSRANSVMYPPINWFEYVNYPTAKYVEENFIEKEQFLVGERKSYKDIVEEEVEENTGTNILSKKLFSEQSRSKYHLKAEEIALKHGLKNYDK